MATSVYECVICKKQHNDVKQMKQCSVCKNHMCDDESKCYEFCFSVNHDIYNIYEEYMECDNILCCKCYNDYDRYYPLCDDCISEVDGKLF